ncbi:MAG: nucleoside phosphorylase [Anaerolineae bacterium]|nr:nucleoside phosphorylase [Anaerolineae bacterium]
MQQHEYPILEFDPAPDALIEPGVNFAGLDDMPECAVLCFFQEVIREVCGGGQARVIYHIGSSQFRSVPIYVLACAGREVAVVHPGVGAPMTAASLEKMISLGVRKFVACGGAGVLDSSIAAGHVVVPAHAVRDEGTSYHYLPPAREVAADPAVVGAIQQTLEAHAVPYLVGKTWTTDAVYRETRAKVARRRAEGCLTVEMEAAAFFAVAQFRGVAFGQLLYGGDDVGGEQWDKRNWVHGQLATRAKLFWLAVEAVLRL